jgi:hypothetical protein
LISREIHDVKEPTDLYECYLITLANSDRAKWCRINRPCQAKS